MSDKFRTIANQRIKRAPFRFFVWLPIRRVASVWLTGFSTHNRPHRFLRILFVLPILIGGVLGFAFFSRKQPVARLLLLVILTRTIFLAYHYAPEARYIVEAYPAMIAACGVSGAALWLYCRQGWLAKWRRCQDRRLRVCAKLGRSEKGMRRDGGHYGANCVAGALRGRDGDHLRQRLS